MAKLTIPGTLPGLNEYTAQNRKNRYAAAQLKKNTQQLIGYCILRQLRNVKFDKPAYVAFHWIEANRKRDKDNIAFAKKFIFDALVEHGVLSGDGWAQIDGFSDSFSVDKHNPRVEVTIEEVQNDNENHCELKHNGCGEWECTKCGYIYTDDYDQIADGEGLVLWHYCPECGRKIGGGIRR